MALDVRRDDPLAVLLLRDVGGDRRARRARRRRLDLLGACATRASARSPPRASMRAIASPIPDEPPVTRAAASADYLRRAGGRVGALRQCSSPEATRSAAAMSAQRRQADRPREARRLRGEVLGGAARGAAAGFVPAEAENLLVGLAPRTTRPSTGSTTSGRSSSRSTSSRRSSTTRRLRPDRRDERAERRLRDGRRAAARALGRRVPRGAAERDDRGDPRRRRRAGRARPARSSPAGTRCATRSRSTASRSSAPSIRTRSGRRAAPVPGDALFLTKPLGTGLAAPRARAGERHEEALAEASRADDGAQPRRGRRAPALRAQAVTDVTGFGLLGHAHEIAARSGVRIVLDAAALPAASRARSRSRAGECGPAATEEPRLRAAQRWRRRATRRAPRARVRPADRRRPADLRRRPTRWPCWRPPSPREPLPCPHRPGERRRRRLDS